MKSILMTTSAVLLVTGFAAGQAQAACPEDIDAFDRQYQQTLQNVAAGQALSASEQAQLFGLRTAAENLHQAGNAEMCAEVVQRANLILETAIAPQVIRPDELVGREVTNASEDNLGEIEEVMLDPVSGRIAYVVVEHGGFLGIGDDLFAVPWGALQFVPGNEKTLLLDIPEEKLENAPRFSRDDESPLERREWVTAVHSYYGVQPYWQDEVGAIAMQYGGGGAMPPSPGDAAGGSEAQTDAATSGEVTTIVVPITDPEGDQPSSSGTSGTGAEPAEAEADAGGQPQGGSAGGSQIGSNLVAVPSPAGASEGSSADVADLAARMDELEQQVRTLSEKMPGEEVTQAIAHLEERIAALDEAGAGTPDQGAGASAEGGQQGAIVVVPPPSGQTGQQPSGGSGSSAEPGPSGSPPQGDEQGQAGDQPAEQDEAGDQPAEQDEAGEPAEQESQAGEQPADQQGQAGEQPAAQGGQTDAQAAASGAAAQPAAAAAEETSGQPCEEQLAQLEDDLRRAEELGVETENAQSEFKEAQAMLNNNSEALCRAAIKRAHESLVAVGFEPTRTN